LRAAPFQPADDRLTNIDRERQAVLTARLALDHHLTGAPVDAVQLQPGYLAGTQAQARQDHQHGEVPTTDHPPTIAAPQHPGDIASIDCLGKRGQPPTGH
jgi:hypothetical protein